MAHKSKVIYYVRKFAVYVIMLAMLAFASSAVARLRP